jgi:hypothetical protein
MMTGELMLSQLHTLATIGTSDMIRACLLGMPRGHTVT